MSSPPRKKVKTKSKFKVKFNSKWLEDPLYSEWLREDPQDVFKASCIFCRCSILIAWGGQRDINIHLKSSKHKKSLNAQSMSGSIQQKLHFMKNSSKKENLSVTAAEVLWTLYTVEHDLSFNASDHMTKLLPRMCPDSLIAKEFRCGRTKTTAILNEALAPSCRRTVVELLQQQPFSIMVDEATDLGDVKTLLIMARAYDGSSVQSFFVAMPECPIANAKTLYETLTTAMADLNVPLDKVIGYGSDSANVMIGNKKSLYSHIRDNNNSNLVKIPCPCHKAHTIVGESMKKMDVRIEDFVIDIFYFFHRSSKRREDLCEFQEFTNTEPRQILKHVSTRWLSLKTSIERILMQWSALLSYFESHEESDKKGSKVFKILKRLRCPKMKMSLHFLSENIEVFTDFNLMYQQEDFMLHTLYNGILHLQRKLLCRFVCPEAIANKTPAELYHLDPMNPDIQRENDDMIIGVETRQLLEENDEMSPAEKTALLSNLRMFLATAVTKLKKVFPFNDCEILELICLLDPERRLSSKTQQVLTLAKLVPLLVPAKDFNTLLDEFADYQTMPTMEMPSQARVDTFWSEMSQVKVPGTALFRFPTLSKLMKGLCCLPHSNADCERVFSKVRHIKTDFRKKLSNKTLQSLLAVKCQTLVDSDCYEQKLSERLLRLAKDATSVTLGKKDSAL